MAASGESTTKGLYLSLNDWAGFAFLFHSQARSLGLAWMLDQALCNPADVRVKAGTNATKWRRKNADADDEENGQHAYKIMRICHQEYGTPYEG